VDAIQATLGPAGWVQSSSASTDVTPTSGESPLVLLARIGPPQQTSYVSWTHNDYVNQQLVATDAYYNIPTSDAGSSASNYNQTDYGYDAEGRQNMVKSPDGNITRTVYDASGRVLSTWVGTNDSGATDKGYSGDCAKKLGKGGRRT
jgi:YD repeat-containing protein